MAATEDGPRTGGLSDLLRYGVALLSAGAAVIHAAVIGQHFDEFWLAGAFFVAAAAFQAGWAILIAVRPRRFLIVAGAAVNAAIVALWVASRTTGIPIGPDAGMPERARFVDLTATGFEILLVVACAALLWPRVGRARLSRLSVTVWALGFGAVVAAFGARAVLGPSGPTARTAVQGHALHLALVAAAFVGSAVYAVVERRRARSSAGPSSGSA